MSEIIKTEAVVLSKMNYGDSSNIASLFTEDLGKLSVIIKGARSPKSKYGKIVDPLNYLLVVLYKKESREVQLLSGADIIQHFPEIKNDLDKLSYAYAVAELIKNLVADDELNKKLFKGVIKILERCRPLVMTINSKPCLPIKHSYALPSHSRLNSSAGRFQVPRATTIFNLSPSLHDSTVRSSNGTTR